MWIVKLGGSLWDAPALRHWLDVIARCPRPITVVPGGGPFADVVRTTQAKLGFDHLAAHRMAILGMQQYAVALASLEPRLPLRRHLDAGTSCIWAPWPQAAEADDLNASWEVTSDSIAGWLAAGSVAEALVLVKSAVVGRRPRLSKIVAAGIVDPALPGLIRDWPGRLRILHRDRPDLLADEPSGEVDRAPDPGLTRS